MIRKLFFLLKRRLRAIKSYNWAWDYYQRGQRKEAEQMWKSGVFTERLKDDPLTFPTKIGIAKPWSIYWYGDDR